MTIEELLNTYRDGTGKVRGLSEETVKKLMIKFTQYHVKKL